MEKEQIIKEEVDELLKRLDVVFESTVSQSNDAYLVQIDTTDDAPLLIGRHGEVLNSLKKVLEAILFKRFGERVILSLNINDYQEKQKERLTEIADNTAQRVIQEGVAMQLGSFNSYERRIIHEHISENYKDLTSTSEGEGVDRVLIVKRKTQ